MPDSFYLLIYQGQTYFYFKYNATRASHVLAGGLGIGPRLKASKASVLPLDDPPNRKTIQGYWKKLLFSS